MDVPDFYFYAKNNHKKLDFWQFLINNTPHATPLEVAQIQKRMIQWL